MTRRTVLTHEFVEHVPGELADGVLYVSIRYATVVHKCCCGCGMEVITPLTPTDWQLTFDGESISLTPSIGNWSFECQSHYWIKRNRVRWAAHWTQEQVDAGRARDRRAKAMRVATISGGVFTASDPKMTLRRRLLEKLRLRLRR